jgi:hypothetical protein
MLGLVFRLGLGLGLVLEPVLGLDIWEDVGLVLVLDLGLWLG